MIPCYYPVLFTSTMKSYGKECVAPIKDTIRGDILERLFITGLREHGFIVNRNLKIYGPLICFTSRFLHWNVASPQAINSDSLFLLSLLYPKPDVFILGMGVVAHNEHDRQLREYLHNTNISYEILSTDLAIHAFNTINAENRFVVGAFFPLDSVRHLEAKSKQELLANENQINDQDGILGASDVTDTHIR
ncbi:hypothetical protein GJ496_006773 [Pomphorhynchus laevis]|nr:hypothetical protein GJ496_006773 [Pomphorhynchus laevis]